MNKKIVGKYVAISGVALLLVLPWEVANTIYSFYILFHDVSLTGTGDPRVMAGGLSSALVSTILGLVLCVPGLALLLVAITALRYRPNWLFWVTLMNSILLLFMVPIGSILGLVGLIVVVLKRKSFDSVVNVT